MRQWIVKIRAHRLRPIEIDLIISSRCLPTQTRKKAGRRQIGTAASTRRLIVGFMNARWLLWNLTHWRFRASAKFQMISKRSRRTRRDLICWFWCCWCGLDDVSFLTKKKHVTFRMAVRSDRNGFMIFRSDICRKTDPIDVKNFSQYLRLKARRRIETYSPVIVWCMQGWMEGEDALTVDEAACCVVEHQYWTAKHPACPACPACRACRTPCLRCLPNTLPAKTARRRFGM